MAASGSRRCPRADAAGWRAPDGAPTTSCSASAGAIPFEVLAINSAVPQPGPFYPLGLGVPEVQRQLRLSPQVLHWFARVEGFQGEGPRSSAAARTVGAQECPPMDTSSRMGSSRARSSGSRRRSATLLPDSGGRLTPELTLVTPEPDDLTSDSRITSSTPASSPRGRPA